MIKTRKDLKYYLQEDAKMNGITDIRGGYFLHRLFPDESISVFKYIRCLRYYEYHLNNDSLHHRVLSILYKFRLRRLGIRYNMLIPANVCGYGLKIGHLAGGGGVLLNAEKIGNYCRFNSGVLIGNKNGQNNRPVIGDNVGFGPGAKAIGKIIIGSNVFVAANAVVVKNVVDNCVVGGIPAKVIKDLSKNDKL